ncbi:hypothetical protein EJB05_00913, partial [Eragrostis curvula]
MAAGARKHKFEVQLSPFFHGITIYSARASRLAPEELADKEQKKAKHLVSLIQEKEKHLVSLIQEDGGYVY